MLRHPNTKGYRSAKNAVVDAVCQLFTSAMTDIDGVVFSTISEDVIILTPDKECVQDTMMEMFAPGKYTADIPITFYVEEFEDVGDFYNVSTKIQSVFAEILTKMSCLLSGRYFREEGYHEILLNTAISFTINVNITDGLMFDRFHCTFDGVR